jgi:SAM-dependent methyltransferase
VDERILANRENWDDRVGVHTGSHFYDVEGWLRDESGPQLRETEALGNVEGLTLLHLQCHFGMGTLSWARVGATVTGLDFSSVAIDEAIGLAERSHLSTKSTFICANVYDAVEALRGRRFDIVYVSLGSLCWLPNIEQWASVVSQVLKVGGRLYLHDVHPFTFCFDEEGNEIVYGYFEEPERPLVSDESYTYTDGRPLAHTRTYEWSHSLGEIVSALRKNGLDLDSLAEHDWTVFKQFAWLEETSTGLWIVPANRPRIPLTFTLLAHLA